MNLSLDKPKGTKLICLTPVVNEGFELDRFLECTSLWADNIIIGYQPSIDDTLEIARRNEKVTIVNSPGGDWNELAMRSLLYEEARKVSAEKRIIFNLDADELISANYMNSPEWKTILNLPKGSIFRMQWANLYKNLVGYWDSNIIEVGFVDDDTSTLSGSIMHMGRVPWPNYDIKILHCTEIKLLHYVYVNLERNLSKKTWYQSYEKVGKGQFGPHITRKYNGGDGGVSNPPVSIKTEWIQGYSDQGLDVTSVAYAYDYSHDYRLLDYLDEMGTEYFKMCNIWDKDWIQFATGKKENPERFKDPRNKLDKLIFRYVWWSIGVKQTSSTRFTIRVIDKTLKLAGYSS
jgi:hypothetical protein